MKKTYSELVAIERLKEIEKKNGGLINGNFSFVAHENKIKVKRLRELYQVEKNEDSLPTIQRGRQAQDKKRREE